MELARVEFVVTLERALDATMHGYDTNSAIRRQHGAVRAYLVLAAVCTGVLTGFVTAAGRSPDWIDGAVGAAVGIPFLLAAVLLPTVLRESAKRSLVRVYRGRGYRPLLGRYRVVVSEDGIGAGTPAAFLQCRWDAVLGIIDRGEYAFIQLTHLFVSVPRNAFLCDDEFDRFVELIRQRVPVDQ